MKKIAYVTSYIMSLSTTPHRTGFADKILWFVWLLFLSVRCLIFLPFLCLCQAILEGLECCWKWWAWSYWYTICQLSILLFHPCRKTNFFWVMSTTGVLEANFVEPAHDKQGFERTTVLARLETRLVQMQKNYWFFHIFPCVWFVKMCSNQVELVAYYIVLPVAPFRWTNCHKIGYAPRRNKKLIQSEEKGNWTSYLSTLEAHTVIM